MINRESIRRKSSGVFLKRGTKEQFPLLPSLEVSLSTSCPDLLTTTPAPGEVYKRIPLGSQ